MQQCQALASCYLWQPASHVCCGMCHHCHEFSTQNFSVVCTEWKTLTCIYIHVSVWSYIRILSFGVLCVSVQRKMNAVLLIDTASEARQFMFSRPPGYHTAYTLDGDQAMVEGKFYSGPYRKQAVYLQASNEEAVRCVCVCANT